MTASELEWRAKLKADGYCLLPSVLGPDRVQSSLQDWEHICSENRGDPAILMGAEGAVSGARNLLRMWPSVVELARLCPITELLGPEAGVVRALYFDKPPGHGWALPWHKDYNIAVRTHGKIGTFSKPTTKAGVPHVEAPVELLETMVTVRVHLDDMNDQNGPLRVIPGSHRERDSRPPVAIHCRSGDVLLMRPLLTHSSAHCEAACVQHRRIVHLECAPTPHLPDGYEWQDFVGL